MTTRAPKGPCEPRRGGARRTSVLESVYHVAHLLPSQLPLHAFVHHNTLHAFEDLPFEEAVVEAGRQLGKEPYPSEEAFAAWVAEGRILERDLVAVLEEEALADERPIFEGGPKAGELRLSRLMHRLEVPEGPALDWLLKETRLLDRFESSLGEGRLAALRRIAQEQYPDLRPEAAESELLHRLWSLLEVSAPPLTERPAGVRRRDQLLAVGAVDTDSLVLPLLIRLGSAFLDQGIAYWTMPGREEGFLVAFRRLYSKSFGPPDRHLRGLSKELRRQEREQWTAEQTILWALDELGIAEASWEAFLRETLLTLPGWAGMMYQLEQRPDRAPVERRPARLADFVAVQLVLERFAAVNTLHDELGEQATFADLEAVLRPVSPATPDRELVYEGVWWAQRAAVDPVALLEPKTARAWLEEIAAFDSLTRRRLLHAAYERRHRVELLDGLQAHDVLEKPDPPAAEFQAVFCIDERECSTRRHLEERHPAVETFGYAGFFGVAISFQGLEDVRPRPLCPPVISPRHRIEERAVEAQRESQYRSARRVQGVLKHTVSVGSKTLTRGGLLTAIAGIAYVIPLVLRCLFPRLAERWAHWVHHGPVHRPTTRLTLERDERPDHEDESTGFAIAEMVEIVASALETMAFERFCDLVYIVGHGSKSLNNPHEAAHDCGATGGGRGGPNARTFAAMVNLPAVRSRLRDRDLDIPDSCWFVGAYHNTCDDSMDYYDEDLVPESLCAAHEQAKRAFTQACLLDAQERCRRFASASLDISPENALTHVETRASDLSQPRPEYGHATNAICIVGRRSRTRGLFLDRRAFLVSYDPEADEHGEVLAALLLSVGPVGAGINLEYYFSYVDPTGYGCGTKLPHNIVGLIGVMDGHASDLRTGLPWQMVEIHEPVRLLTIVEAKPVILERLLEEYPPLERLVRNRWIQLVAWDPESPEMHVFEGGELHPYRPETTTLPIVDRSFDHFHGQRGHLGCAHVRSAFGEGER